MNQSEVLKQIEEAVKELGLSKRTGCIDMGYPNLTPNLLFGHPIYEAPRVQKIKLSDKVTVSDEFRKKTNQWLLDMFGYKELLEGHTALMYGNNIIMSKEAILHLNSTV